MSISSTTWSSIPFQGKSVYLKDVAHVVDSYKEQQSYAPGPPERDHAEHRQAKG